MRQKKRPRAAAAGNKPPTSGAQPVPEKVREASAAGIDREGRMRRFVGVREIKGRRTTRGGTAPGYGRWAPGK